MEVLSQPYGHDAVPPEVFEGWGVARKKDVSGYCVERTFNAYLGAFAGLSKFLERARQLPASNLIVDVGAGVGRAINELADDPELSRGLTFMATGLTAINEGRVPYVVTGAELLHVPRAAGILAEMSIVYSRRPDMVAASFADRLVPGGMAKAHVPYYDGGPYPLGAARYLGTLREQGLDAAMGRLVWGGGYVVAAIKPGAEAAMSAEELLAKDAEGFRAMREQWLARYPDPHPSLPMPDGPVLELCEAGVNSA